jgi:hypothetical protein
MSAIVSGFFRRERSFCRIYHFFLVFVLCDEKKHKNDFAAEKNVVDAPIPKCTRSVCATLLARKYMMTRWMKGCSHHKIRFLQKRNIIVAEHPQRWTN